MEREIRFLRKLEPLVHPNHESLSKIIEREIDNALQYMNAIFELVDHDQNYIVNEPDRIVIILDNNKFKQENFKVCPDGRVIAKTLNCDTTKNLKDFEHFNYLYNNFSKYIKTLSAIHVQLSKMVFY